MAGLCNRLVNEGLFDEWAGILDWLFDEERFSTEFGWSSGYIGQFAKKVKRLPYLSEKNYFYDSAKKLDFPKAGSNRDIKMLLSKGDAEARDIVRHIRNGIAHGKTAVLKLEGTLYIEILDYSIDKKQSAYIFFPMTYMSEIHKIYCDIQKSINNSKKPRKGN